MADGLRQLTCGEVELLRSVFGAGIAFETVRIVDGFGLSPIAAIALHSPHVAAITLRRTIHFGRHHSIDYAGAAPEPQALLVHEMTHVRQWAELGVARFLARYFRELSDCGWNQKAMYRYAPRQPFASARLEAQAQMVQDYFLARALGKPLEDLAAGLAGSGLYGL
ncbi:MAG TPA: DUF4157 domain-containing protein [Allosphingosinicella sp.]|jgi:hypothetical protein